MNEYNFKKEFKKFLKENNSKLIKIIELESEEMNIYIISSEIEPIELYNKYLYFSDTNNILCKLNILENNILIISESF